MSLLDAATGDLDACGQKGDGCRGAEPRPVGRFSEQLCEGVRATPLTSPFLSGKTVKFICMDCEPSVPARTPVPVTKQGVAVIALMLMILIATGFVAHHTRLRRSADGALPASSEPAPDKLFANVFFSPGDQPTLRLVDELNAASYSIHVQAYSFTSAPIAKALVEAKKRGLDVIAVLDKGQKSVQYSSADFLAHEGVATFIDAKHAIAHNKIMIIDGGTVVTGSFNFTKAAEESNAENLLVLRDAALAARYELNFRNHLTHSEPYAGR